MKTKPIKIIFLCAIPLISLLTFVSWHLPNKGLTEKSGHTWWKEAVVYQIYPRSFKDSNGDGVGDLKGIVSKLDYIKSLGVDVVWLNPIYSSPNDDNGYDVSDYRNIMNDFGSMQDFDALLEGVHHRGIKLVMDLVVNHSSDEHDWFKQSRSSRTSPYRDYYHWWPDENSDAWRYDSLTNAYYLHYFSRKQPDLNWENPIVRKEVYDMMKFWLDKGVDGFRIDAFQFAAKDTTWPVLPKGYEKSIVKYYGMGPHLHDYLKEMNSEVISKYDIMTVAEGAGSTMEDAHNLVDADRHELNMAYHFEGMDIGNSPGGYSLLDFKKVYTKWDSAFVQNGWVSIFLANHDVPRMVSKFGNDNPQFREVSSKMLTTFIMTMRGTPYYYNGDELGMTNIRFDKIEDYRDISTIIRYKYLKKIGGNVDSLLENQKFVSRDNCRTPFQWDSSANAGFTTGNPWIKVNPNYKTINADIEEGDQNSVLNYFRKVVKLRKENPVLVYGKYTLLDKANPNVYAYTRSDDHEKMLVILNFSKNKIDWNIPSGIELTGNVLINNYKSVESTKANIALNPYQALVLKVK
jgi:oligo-1,6-glucosidase